MTFPKYPTSVLDIYDTETPTIPQGFKAVEFRPATERDVYLRTNGFEGRGLPTKYPVIILEEDKQYQFILKRVGGIVPGEWGIPIAFTHETPIILLENLTPKQAGNCWPGMAIIFDRVEVKEK